MKIIIFYLIVSSSAAAQINFDEHIKSIKENYYQSEDQNGKFNVNERSVDYALLYLKNNNIKEKFVTNRKLLTKIESVECKDSSFIYFFKKLANDTEIEIKIKFKKFNPQEHVIKEVNHANNIDGNIAFGAYYGIPLLEIDCLKINVNGNNLRIPEAIYKKFYEVSQCSEYLFYEPVKAFCSEDGRYIFIYVKGGNAANTYFSKLIFNQEEYLTEIVADYTKLIEWRAINNEEFIGF